MYYSVKLNYLVPKEGTDEMQKVSKQYLTYAESVTEAEAKVINWTPANYQDPVIPEVKKTNIGELRLKGKSETFWLIKIMDDGDGTRKAKPYYAIYDGDHLPEVVKLAASEWSGNEIEEVKKFKQVVDDDLISEATIVPRAKTTGDDLEELDALSDGEEDEIDEAA